INFLIPEVIETVEFHKGAHHADHGDFSFAAAQDFNVYGRVDRGTAGFDVGEYGLYRGLVVDSVDVGMDGSLFYALDVSTNDGPWDVPEDMKRYSGVLKYTRPLGKAQLSLLGIGYDA